MYLETSSCMVVRAVVFVRFSPSPGGLSGLTECQPWTQTSFVVLEFSLMVTRKSKNKSLIKLKKIPD